VSGSLLTGRSAVVTGAAQGIGFATALALGLEGARVVLVDRGQDDLSEAASSLDDQGIETLAVVCDVTIESDVERAIGATVGAFGGLDVLVNNAGITRDMSIRRMTLEDFQAVLSVNLAGSWLTTKYAAAAMRVTGGSIVNVSSISGKIGNAGQTNYSAAKAGVIGLTKSSAKELAKSGIRVNAIQPGLIRSSMTRAMRPEVFAEREAMIPLGRAGEPEEVAKVAVFLASDLSSYMTGAVLEVSGGRAM
jgi:3-oxoacyl-[acyl-carrier protein] reductase